MGRPEAVASCALQASFIPPGCHLLVCVWGGALGNHQHIRSKLRCDWLVPFHLGRREGGYVEVCHTDWKARDKWLVMELRRESLALSTVCLRLLSSQD